MASGLTGELVSQLALLKEQNAKTFEAVTGIEAAGGAKLDLEVPMGPDSPSIAGAHAKIHALIGLVEGITSATDKALGLVPANHLSGLPKEVGRVAETLTNLLNHIRDIIKDHGGFGAIDSSGFTIQSQNGQIATNLVDTYQNIRTATDAALDRAHRVLSITSPESYDAFAGAVAGVEETLGALTKARQEAADHLKKIKAAANASVEDARRAAENAASTAVSKQATDETVAKINADLGQANKLLRDIEAVATQAQTLKGQVEAYQKTFTDFDAQLAERNKQFAEGKQALDTLIKTRSDELAALVKSLQTHNATADTIIANAKDALQWGTAQGLSSSFATSAKELDEPLKSTMSRFVWSIVALAVWIAIIFFVIPIFYPAFTVFSVPNGLTGASAGAYILGAVAVRIAVIAPVLILVLFFGRRYRALYAVRELYIFKKTVAASLPGFKETAAAKDADDHVKAMTAAAFERLLFNPREQATNDLADTPRGGFLSRWLVRLIKQAWDESTKPPAKP
jgi:hypothetical protein